MLERVKEEAKKYKNADAFVEDIHNFFGKVCEWGNISIYDLGIPQEVIDAVGLNYQGNPDWERYAIKYLPQFKGKTTKDIDREVTKYLSDRERKCLGPMELGQMICGYLIEEGILEYQKKVLKEFYYKITERR